MALVIVEAQIPVAANDLLERGLNLNEFNMLPGKRHCNTDTLL